MTRAQLVERMNGHVQLTWKQLLWVFGVVLPWAMTISVGVAMANYVNSKQQDTLDTRTKAVEQLAEVRTDVGWLKESQRRIEKRLFGNSVIPEDQEEGE